MIYDIVRFIQGCVPGGGFVVAKLLGQSDETAVMVFVILGSQLFILQNMDRHHHH